MSEKIKGMYGSETRADEVIEWLKSQGADTMPSIENLKDSEVIFYVNKDKKVMKLHIICAELFDIVELPRWRAEIGGRFYFINYIGKVDFDTDLRRYADNSAYEIGNYFQTKEEAEKYIEKFHEIFK